MDGSLRALLEGLIDYAGLFPPAELDMERAVRKYIEYHDGEDVWMLARFVVPATQREEYLASLPENPEPLALSVLARSDSIRENASLLPADSFETRLPVEFIAGRDERSFAGWVNEARGELTAAGCPEAMLYLEAAPPEAMDAVIGGIALSGDHRIGYKIRTGGLEPEAFPPADELAAVVIACRDAGVPFKATAGLHHPIRHFDEDLGTRMHGFLNLFGGAALALEHGLDAAALTRILEDEDPRSWRFQDDALRWRELSAPAETVRRARRTLATSFGSCSFDDPRKDLRALKLLAPSSPH